MVEKRLLEDYKKIFAGKMNTPLWAVHKNTPGHTGELIHCPIPFIGKYYERQKTKILLYASAENLSDYHSTGKNYLDCDNYAINRHRNSFDASATNPELFFPDVHIQPVNDGCLLIAALYIYSKFQDIRESSPAEFLEQIALANYCKYTIQPDHTGKKKQNQDYANKVGCLKVSHEYIECDLTTLRPDIIIIPKTIYRTDKEFIDSIKGTAKIIPIYQINARNINLRIKKYPRTDPQDLNKVIYDWYNHLENNGIQGKTKENFLSIFQYLDDVLQNL